MTVLVGSKLNRLADGSLMFHCPGCGSAHRVTVGDGPGPCWGWNGSGDAPTFTPSILVRGVRIDSGSAEIERIIDNYKLPEEREAMLADKRINTICHSFVTDGRIQFLSDCSHALAGKTVDLPDWESSR